MKNKEKIILSVMIILFSLSTGLFYYHNIYTNIQSEKSKVPILIAIKDIDKGVKLTKDNTSWEMMDKNLKAENNNITEKDMDKLVTTSKIYKDELINKNRLTENINENEFNSYIINIHPDFSYSVEPGDLIRVYVQSIDKEGNIESSLIFDSKEVVAISPPETNSNLETLAIEVTDSDAISYYNAKQIGEIIVLKYKNNYSKPDLEMPLIDIYNNNTNNNYIKE